ncbi:unnamed protein product [Ambrosiozyma monospora]|uniref:Unnamed protein product n=1 Tax=Ambrosiozyma monospora TaxID=43982 RepID=A0ACB5SXJ0_AMBMO|nr:unnamed protein product [Ambrosiozyma monospora]
MVSTPPLFGPDLAPASRKTPDPVPAPSPGATDPGSGSLPGDAIGAANAVAMKRVNKLAENFMLGYWKFVRENI